MCGTLLTSLLNRLLSGKVGKDIMGIDMLFARRIRGISSGRDKHGTPKGEDVMEKI
jgi:hypothetical protein